MIVRLTFEIDASDVDRSLMTKHEFVIVVSNKSNIAAIEKKLFENAQKIITKIEPMPKVQGDVGFRE